MYDSKVHHRVEDRILEREILSIPREERDLVRVSVRQPAIGTAHQAIFQIEREDPLKAHCIYQELSSFAQPAADLKRVSHRYRTGQVQPFVHFTLLKEDPNRAIYPHPFRPIHQHLRFLGMEIDGRLPDGSQPMRVPA